MIFVVKSRVLISFPSHAENIIFQILNPTKKNPEFPLFADFGPNYLNLELTIIFHTWNFSSFFQYICGTFRHKMYIITKFRCSSTSYCWEMQGCAKLHNYPSPPPRNRMFRDFPQNRVKMNVAYFKDVSHYLPKSTPLSGKCFRNWEKFCLKIIRLMKVSLHSLPKLL